MARRRKRDSEIATEKAEIDVNRNPIEAFLVKLFSAIRSKRKNVIIVILLFVLILGGLISGSLYYDEKYKINLVKFEELFERYQEVNDKSKVEDIKKLIADLKKYESGSFGSIKDTCKYLIGDLCYQIGDYKQAREYFSQYSDGASSYPFAVIARVNTAISFQNEKQYDKALAIYKELEKEYANKSIENYIIYNFANLYASKNDVKNARIYYNKIITLYPNTFFARLAKKRILLLSAM